MSDGDCVHDESFRSSKHHKPAKYESEMKKKACKLLKAHRTPKCSQKLSIKFQKFIKCAARGSFKTISFISDQNKIQKLELNFELRFVAVIAVLKMNEIILEEYFVSSGIAS